MKLDNFLALEPYLVARLVDQLASLSPKVHVMTAASLAGVTEDKQTTPAVQVVYQGYKILEARSDGTLVRVEQTWLAVVAIKNMKNLRSGAAAREDVGLIAVQVARALMGFKPPVCLKPLQLVDGPSGGFSAGHQYLPLAFQAELRLATND